MRERERYDVGVYLDGLLGRWTRLLPWREELGDHLEELYDVKRGEGRSSDEAWDETLQEFGDVKQVGEELWQEHKPRGLVVRGVVVAAAIGCVLWMVGSAGVFADAYVMALVMIPLVGGIAGVLLSKEMRLRDVDRLMRLSLAGGCVTGLTMMVLVYPDPSRLGAGMAICVLSALFAIVLLRLGFWLMLLFGIANILALSIVSWLMTGSVILDFFRYETAIVEEYFVLTLAGIGLGWVRWGEGGIIRHLPQILLGAMFVHIIVVMWNITSPNALWSEMTLVVIVVVVCLMMQLYTSSRQEKRIPQ